jgi:hypothetical protein
MSCYVGLSRVSFGYNRLVRFTSGYVWVVQIVSG